MLEHSAVEVVSAVRWTDAMRCAIRSGKELMAALSLPAELACSESEADFPVFAPWEYVRRMQSGDPHDPLLLQVLATHAERDSSATGQLDPVGDLESEVVPGLLKKYARRALLITTGVCAIHCRYCFRRNFPYQSAPTGPEGWRKAIDSIRDDNSLEEVILSGGDPLSVRDASLRRLVNSLNAIPHVSRIRLHTRFPVVIPSRICDELLQWVSESRCAMYFVLHFNHAAEIDKNVESAMRLLRKAGASLLNQSVLLRGINDSWTTQRELCRALIELHVLPYYLHQLDPVQGGVHFGVSDTEALQIIAKLQSELPGYAIPRLVREIAGHPHKLPV